MERLPWKELEKLRSLFLHQDPKIRLKDYWDSEETLQLYDDTFAQRIGWKWASVLEEFKSKYGENLGFKDSVHILDWGCGSGIASRTFLKVFAESFSNIEVSFFDRSPKASLFAAKKLREDFPQVKISAYDKKKSPQILLLSHVLNELDADTLNELKTKIVQTELSFWVEAGSFDVSRQLIALREELKTHLRVLAPCPHQQSCPMLEDKNAKHWCHNFAEAPEEVFHSGFWRQFSRTLKIDLRSLPTSFLIMAKSKNPAESGSRILGRNRVLKSHVEQVLCLKGGGIEEQQWSKRLNPKEYKDYKDTYFYRSFP